MDLQHFTSIAMSDELQKGIADIGYDVATSIQSQAIPIIMNGEDVIGLSQTGSGKTAAFGLPAIDLIDTELSPKIVQALIICPTRELAMQSCGELKKFAKYKPRMNIVPIFGGDSISKQMFQLRNGCQIVVGTPGRIMDHMRRRTLNLENVKMVVLDEADEMLKMGFLEDIETILSSTPENRQTLLFSATMSKEVMRITNKFQKDPKTVKIEAKQKTVSTIEQYYCVAPRGKKAETLYSLIEFYKPTATIVFCNTKKMVDELVENLKNFNYLSKSIHGDMRQSERTRVISEFKNHQFQVLVATDVVARGIDINDVEFVINYDLPQEDEYYIHRIGRTGRAGKTGKAVSLIQSSNQLHQLMNIADYANCKIDKLAIPTKKQIRLGNTDILCNEIKEYISKSETNKYTDAIEGLKAEGYTSEIIAAAAFEILMKQRSAYEDVAEDVGMIKADEIQLTPKKVKPAQKKSQNKFDKKNYDNSNMATIKLSIGRKDNVSPNHILGAAAGETGLSGKVFGAINIDTRSTTIDVPKELKKKVVESLNNSKIKGIKVKAYIV